MPITDDPRLAELERGTMLWMIQLARSGHISAGIELLGQVARTIESSGDLYSRELAAWVSELAETMQQNPNIAAAQLLSPRSRGGRRPAYSDDSLSLHDLPALKRETLSQVAEALRRGAKRDAAFEAGANFVTARAARMDHDGLKKKYSAATVLRWFYESQRS